MHGLMRDKKTSMQMNNQECQAKLGVVVGREETAGQPGAVMISKEKEQLKKRKKWLRGEWKRNGWAQKAATECKMNLNQFKREN